MLKSVVDQPHEFGRRVLSPEVRVRRGAMHQSFFLEHLEPSFDFRELVFVDDGGRGRKRLRRHWVLERPGDAFDHRIVRSDRQLADVVECDL